MNAFSQIFTMQNSPKFCLKSFCKNVNGFTSSCCHLCLKQGLSMVLWHTFEFIQKSGVADWLKKKICVWWWIKKKMVFVYFEAHQCVLSKIHNRKFGKIFVEDFASKKWRDSRLGWTCIEDQNWGLCVALHASKFIIQTCQIIKKKICSVVVNQKVRWVWQNELYFLQKVNMFNFLWEKIISVISEALMVCFICNWNLSSFVHLKFCISNNEKKVL